MKWRVRVSQMETGPVGGRRVLGIERSHDPAKKVSGWKSWEEDETLVERRAIFDILFRFQAVTRLHSPS